MGRSDCAEEEESASADGVASASIGKRSAAATVVRQSPTKDGTTGEAAKVKQPQAQRSMRPCGRRGYKYRPAQGNKSIARGPGLSAGQVKHCTSFCSGLASAFQRGAASQFPRISRPQHRLARSGSRRHANTRLSVFVMLDLGAAVPAWVRLPQAWAGGRPDSVLETSDSQ